MCVRAREFSFYCKMQFRESEKKKNFNLTCLFAWSFGCRISIRSFCSWFFVVVFFACQNNNAVDSLIVIVNIFRVTVVFFHSSKHQTSCQWIPFHFILPRGRLCIRKMLNNTVQSLNAAPSVDWFVDFRISRIRTKNEWLESFQIKWYHCQVTVKTVKTLSTRVKFECF